MTNPPSPAPPRVRRRTLVLGGLGLVVALLLLPVLLAVFDAHAAKSDLESAQSALRHEDYTRAKAEVSAARGHVDRASQIIRSPIGDLWGSLPGTEGAVRDFRLLTSALDDTTSVAEIGLKLYPEVAGEHATLLEGERLDQTSLHTVITGVQAAGARLTSASTSLAQVRGDSPLVGGGLRKERDDALDDIQPLVDSYQQARPLIGQLPELLGMDGRRRYLIAMLNPAELRYSGGATLSLAALTTDHGLLQLNQSLDLEGTINPFVKYRWPKVQGNPFHGSSAMPLRNATFAPSWRVSGEELLRAVHAGFGKTYDGLITVDVVAMANLLNITGALEVPGYGTLSSDNLVSTLVGSYDKYPDPQQRHQLNQSLIPAFRERLFQGGHLADKAKSLTESAAGGHFAIYMRDRATEAAIEDLGMAGELSDTPHDYVGVFTQNLNGSKLDIYQRRYIDYDVAIHPDGSAEATLTVQINNPTPPYSQPGADPGVGYFTRIARMSIAAFLPDGATLLDAASDGQPLQTHIHDFYGRPWVNHATTVPPNGNTRLSVHYRLPDAATVEGHTLRYDLTFQPQGTVVPPTLSARVHLPAGYHASAVPKGWSSDGNTLSYQSGSQPTLISWHFTARQTP